jgi:hypothetical protein
MGASVEGPGWARTPPGGAFPWRAPGPGRRTAAAQERPRRRRMTRCPGPSTARAVRLLWRGVGRGGGTLRGASLNAARGRAGDGGGRAEPPSPAVHKTLCTQPRCGKRRAKDRKQSIHEIRRLGYATCAEGLCNFRHMSYCAVCTARPLARLAPSPCRITQTVAGFPGQTLDVSGGVWNRDANSIVPLFTIASSASCRLPGGGRRAGVCHYGCIWGGRMGCTRR